MADMTTADLLPGIAGSIVQKRLVDMGDGTFAEMTVATLAASSNLVGTVNLGSLGGAATAANQTLGNATLQTVAAPFSAAASTPLTATVNDTSTHTFGPFTPQLARAICLTVNGTTAATGSLQVLRSIDGGANKLGLTAAGQPWASYTFGAATGGIVNEQVWNAASALETFYIACTLSAGAVSINLHQ